MSTGSSVVAIYDKVRGVVHVGKKDIKIGSPLPSAKDGERLIRFTSSLCPQCFRILPAAIIEREGALYIRRTCPEHGEVEELYYSDAEMFKRIERYTYDGKGPGYAYTANTAPCPLNCGLCPMHRTHTALLNIDVTNRCDLSCWYCFYFAERAGYVYEPTLEDIKNMIESLRKQQDIVLSVQLTGGEPTLREDLVDIVKLLRTLGVRHIQLNTHGIKFARLYFEDQNRAVAYAKSIREAGVNTVYLSFDGVTPHTNPKNHWEVPYTLQVFREAGLTSVVFVPTVIKGVNDHELGDILKIAAHNMDVVRGVNFQPVSLVGMMRKQDRARYRITIPDVIKAIEEQSGGEIDRNSWFPVGAEVPIARFMELLSPRKRAEFTCHPACGVATYVYVNKSDNGYTFEPITRFIDAEGLLEYLDRKADSLYSKPRYISKLGAYAAIFNILNRFILWDKVPKDIKNELRSILLDIFFRRNYEALGRFHYKFLFIGMMHFMDEWNYDVSRVMRCAIHYALPDGRIVPFCAFNILNDIYRDTPHRTFGVSLEEYLKIHGEKSLAQAKYVRSKELIEKMMRGEPYAKFYTPVMDKIREYIA
uniref:Radical SAM protein n=1 Tax=Ignisphaera aggregans TaxID=334771 RepID=A0A7C2Z9S7_9CREN